MKYTIDAISNADEFIQLVEDHRLFALMVYLGKLRDALNVPEQMTQ